MILVYITNPSKEEAKKVAKHLLQKKLIACANIFPMESMYHWDGKLADEEEYVILGKTNEGKYGKIVNEVEKIHSYEIPCVIKVPADVNDRYRNWLEKEIS